ncbi:MAG: hypothetical protein IPK16_28880 [Anaerolineales bacterium]|nr:hypothetical protein [Anaerolineales bacterium]
MIRADHGAAWRWCSAGAIVYDALANPALLAEAASDAELIYAGKRAGRHAFSQDEINDLLVQKAREHALVVRLKGRSVCLRAGR